MAMGNPVGHAVLVLTRCALGYSCRRYLGHIYNDLRNLSSDTSSSTANNLGAPASPMLELETLPSPVLSPATPSMSIASQASAAHRKTLARPLSVRWPAEVSLAQFSLLFSECCVLFLLVTCHALDIFDSDTRWIHWRISLALVTLQLLIAIPLVQCLLVTSRTHRSALSRAILTLIPFCVYLVVVSRVSPPATLGAPDLTKAYLARYIVLGVCILGLLSGVGATASFWDYILEPFLFSRSKTSSEISDSDISSTERALARIQKDISNRELQLERREALAGEEAQQSKGSWVSRVFGGSDKEIVLLNTELSSLRMLESEMSNSLSRMRARHADVAFGRTIGGIVLGFALRVFGLYCALRICSTIWAILRPSAPGTGLAQTGGTADIGAQILGVILPYLPFLPVEPTPENAAIIARHASLILVGAIVMSSVRLVLRGVNRALRVTSRRRINNSNERSVGAAVMLLILAQLMGTYLLSTLIQLRTSFPPDSTGRVESLFSSLPGYEPFEPAFNIAFVGSAVVAGVLRAIGWAGL